MAETAAQSDAGAAERFETARDRSLYWTISFLLSPEDLPKPVRTAVEKGLAAPLEEAASLRSIQAGHAPSLTLSDAIEPLFADISDRERLGRIDDYLFAVGEGQAVADLEIAIPDTIAWETEGVRFEASPGRIGPQSVRLRRFWYVHKNGALSWHLSFRVDYEHTPAHFYFISMLQKALAPKEFRPAGPRITTELQIHAPPQGGTGIAPLDAVKVSAPGLADASFWQAVAHWFEMDAPDLFDRLTRSHGWRDKHAPAADLFGNLIRREPFIEIPGLMMPRFRFMFFFQDKDFFRRLLPVEAATGQGVPRAAMVLERCYQPFLDQIAARTPADGGAVKLDADYWTWAMTRPDYAEAKQKYPDEFAKTKSQTPAWEEDTRPDCLAYLFLSGFNQNIIDFMNQDASEILDSTDPIYPRTEDQTSERFYVRFANSRALTTYVRSSRSLEAGNDYIGTCPYAFLIHALALHNEFLARDYERATHTLIADVTRLNDKHRLGLAAERFYRFRTGVYARHFEERYENVFRYDTEADVFAEVEKRRGTSRKTGYLEGIVENLEKQTGDLEARIQKREDRVITYAVAAVGMFGLFQIALQVIGMLQSAEKYGADTAGAAKAWEGPLIIATMIGSAIALVPLSAVVGGDILRAIGGWIGRRRRRGR